MKIPLYSQEGAKTGEIEVSEKIFGRKANAGLIHKILVRQLANRRGPIAHTKTKGEVRGGGKKPWRQKGTGRARQGSTRNPHFIGGGVAFGPRNTRNYKTRANKKERRAALFGVLSEKFSGGHIAALESFSAETPKTKIFAAMLKKLPFPKKVLFILPEKNELVKRVTRNIPTVKTIFVNSLNLDDVIKYQDIVFFKQALPRLEELSKL